MKKRVIIVGAGMAGLTAAAYLAKSDYNVLLIEKGNNAGGLLNSFTHNGFTFDGGARSIENSGVIRPMLTDLGIALDLIPSSVSLGIEDRIIDYKSDESLYEYQNLLKSLYPDNKNEIDTIIQSIKKILRDMAILYGIDNPNFRDMKNDKKYLFKQLLPWLGKFIRTVRRINKIDEPVEAYLAKISHNQSLNDIIAQHFFKQTPAFFALGYFYVYLDYLYPKGGTGELPNALLKEILKNGAKFQTDTFITDVLPAQNSLIDKEGNRYNYDYLVWAADLKSFYKMLNLENLPSRIIKKTHQQKEIMLSKHGGDSIFSLYLAVNKPPEYFKSISHGHFFYTPSRKGLGQIHRAKLQSLLDNFEEHSKEEVLDWLEDFIKYNTFEIAIPVLKDPDLAPKGKTGLIVSLLFEYDLIQKIEEQGWYEEFKKTVEKRIITTLTETVYPELDENLLFHFSSTPLSIHKRTNSSEGAITGWSFESSVPVVDNLLKMPKATKTPLPNIYQAGQWAYSPAGIPTAILTGWLAAKKIMKQK